MTLFKREIKWEPGFDHRNDPDKKQYGCHGMNIRWLLHGEKGTIQFLIFTQWLPTWQPHQSSPHFDVLPADLGYHSDIPRYPEQEPMECEYRGSGQCYYDGSGLRAYEVFKVLVKNGEEAVWRLMEEEYEDLFENKT